MAFHWVIFIFVISFGMHKILIVYISLSLFFPSQIFRFLFLLCLWVMQAIRLRHSGAARPSTTDKTEDPRMQKKTHTQISWGNCARRCQSGDKIWFIVRLVPIFLFRKYEIARKSEEMFVFEYRMPAVLQMKQQKDVKCIQRVGRGNWFIRCTYFYELFGLEFLDEQSHWCNWQLGMCVVCALPLARHTIDTD